MTTEDEIAALPLPASPAGMDRMLSSGAAYLACNIAFKVIGFIMIPFYASFLSIDEYGVLQLLELATTVVAIIFGLQSLGPALTRVAHDEPESARGQVVSTALISTIILSGLICLLAALFAGPLSTAVSLDGQANLLRAGFAAMFLSSICEVVLVYERMQSRAAFVIVYLLITWVITLGLNIFFIGFAHQGVWGFVYSKLAVGGFSTLYLIIRLVNEVGLAWRAPIARALARFAGPLIVSGASFFAIHFSDRLFLAHVSRAEVGVYSQSYTFAFLLSVLIGDSFNKIWSVSFYGLASGDGWQQRFVQVCRWLICILGTSAMGISLFGRDVLVLMVPPSYDPPVLLLPVLTFGYFLREVGDFFNSMLLIGIGSGLVGRIAAFGALFNLALNALLIPPFGIWGAAWATFITWAGYCAVTWLFAWRLHKTVMSIWPLLSLGLIAGLGLGLRFAMPRFGLEPGPITTLACDSLISLLFCAAIALLYLNSAERHQAVQATLAAWRKARFISGLHHTS